MFITWKEAYSDPANTAPTHDFKWARKLTLDGWHLDNPELEREGFRLVFRGRELTLAKYNKLGYLVETRGLTDIEYNSKTWKLWNDNGNIIIQETEK